MGGQIKLKNNEAFELSECLARLAQSKVFQDLKIVCQVLCCISCLAKAFRHGIAVFGVKKNFFITNVERQNICKNAILKCTSVKLTSGRAHDGMPAVDSFGLPLLGGLALHLHQS